MVKYHCDMVQYCNQLIRAIVHKNKVYACTLTKRNGRFGVLSSAVRSPCTGENPATPLHSSSPEPTNILAPRWGTPASRFKA